MVWTPHSSQPKAKKGVLLAEIIDTAFHGEIVCYNTVG